MFTTYALSLSFFEAIVLDALVRGGGRQATILSDVEGVRAALGEHGAQRIGRHYEVEPILVEAGVFHAKICAMFDSTEAHLLVGSGNLTFGGWGVNLEAIEHLYPQIAPDVFEDAAAFFEGVATAPHLKHDALAHCDETAGLLRRAAKGIDRTGKVRLFHNLEVGVGVQIALAADQLGGASRLVVAAPFWDAGEAIDDLCRRLGLSEVFVHVHEAGTVAGRAGGNWPTRPKVEIKSAHVEILREQAPRRLHAKLFEVLCRRGRIIVSGSANASSAALSARKNVETCIARIQPDRQTGWILGSASPPEVVVAEETTDEPSERVGILRAILEGNTIRGRVLSACSEGLGTFYVNAGTSSVNLGTARLGSDGLFSIDAREIERMSWSGGRLVLRVTDSNSRSAEGFVSVEAYAAVARRAGVVASRLFAIIQGTETPADVAAIMAWFSEDPARMANWEVTGTGDGEPGSAPPEAVIPISVLGTHLATGFDQQGHSIQPEERSWQRFMMLVAAAFRERRAGPASSPSPTPDEEDDSPDDAAARQRERQRCIDKFEGLLKLLLKSPSLGKLLLAFDLAQFVGERVYADEARVLCWVRDITAALLKHPIPADRSQAVAAAIVLLAKGKSDQEARRARVRLLQLRFDLAGAPPAFDSVAGFICCLSATPTPEETWQKILSIRTAGEQCRAYLRALDAGHPGDGYPDLPALAAEVWPKLEAAIGNKALHRRIDRVERARDACTKCGITLPSADLKQLRTVGVSKGCCFSVVIVTGDEDQ